MRLRAILPWSFSIVQDYVDIEAAKHTGRTNFEEMVRLTCP
jgi:hypothetical protein